MNRGLEEVILERAIEKGLISAGQLREVEEEVSQANVASASERWGERIELLIQKGWMDEAEVEALSGESQPDSVAGVAESPALTRHLPPGDEKRTLVQKEHPPKASLLHSRRRTAYIPIFSPNQLIADRYRVICFIAQGGMGEVYEVEDLELQERVALKTILPEIVEDERAIARFKREINLARKVSHSNVCRTFDIGHHRIAEAEGEVPGGEVTFLTMEFLAGETLEERIRRMKRLTPAEALPLVRQMAEALNAAHRVGIVHRDFKSRNVILVPAEGEEAGVRAVITDFGLARGGTGKDSIDAAVTVTGEILGTPAYMAPEQVEGGEITPAVDIYALGVVMYEMITGRWPFTGETLSSLVRRLKEPPPSPRVYVSDLDPKWEAAILCCLERDPADRFASAVDLVNELSGEEVGVGTRVLEGQSRKAVGEEQRQKASEDTYLTRKFDAEMLGLEEGQRQKALEDAYGTRKIDVGTLDLKEPKQTAPLEKKRKQRWWLAAAGLAVLLLVTVGVLFKGNISFRPPASQGPVRLLVADFSNTTADPIFDGTLEPVFSIALEGASFINSYKRDEARKVAGQLQAGATRLDESLARLVAARAGINVVVAGTIARQGDGYRMSIKAVDAVTGKEIIAQEIVAANKQEVLAAAGRLAARIRNALGDTTPESVQLAAAETFTTASLEAAHIYAVAQELQWAGKLEEAIRSYSHATRLDPDLGRAYAGMAAVYANLGHLDQAEKYYQMAMARTDRMTEREKYRTRGGYYLLVRNHQKAIEEFSALVEQYPADSGGLTNLPLAYFYRRDMARALEESRRAVEAYPKDVIKRNNGALYAMYAGDFETAIREANKVLEINPSFGKAYIALALSKLAQGQSAQAAETYQRLAGISVWGASSAVNGLADLALYEGRLSDAAAILGKGIESDRASNNNTGTAYKLTTLAYSHLTRGQTGPALAAVDQAVARTKNEGMLFVAARVYLGAGQEKKALDLALELSARLEPEPQLCAKLIEGEVQMARGKARQALNLFLEAQRLDDTWLGRFDLGRAYLELGAFTEASSEFEACLKRRGEATAVLLDDVPSYRYLPPVYYYLGRAQEGLRSPGAAESYRTFLTIKEKGDGDPLVADARRRLAGH
ncbi:MAG: protein kinase [Acidobacteria bacterium]|nr:protein kinase [Acidobacteriota bacterium]